MMRRIEKIAPILDQLVVSGANFLLTLLLARVLDISSFGLFSMLWLIVISVLSLIQSMFFSPMFSFIPKLSIGDRRKFLNLIYTEILVFILLVLSVTMVLIGVALLYDLNSLVLTLKLFLLIIVPYYMYEFLRRALMVDDMNVLLLLMDALVYTMILTSIYVYSRNSISIIIIIIIIFLFFGLSSVMLIAYRKMEYVGSFRKNEEYSEMFTKQIRFSKWLVASSGLQFVSGNLITIIVGLFVSINQVGYIKMAQNIIGVINPIYVYLDNHAQLYLARVVHLNGIKAGEKTYQLISLVSLSFLVVLLLCIFIFKEDVVVFLYGVQDNVIYEYVVVMLLLSFITGFNVLQRLMLKVLEKTREIFQSYVYASLISSIFIIPCIYYYEGVGAVLVMIIAQMVMLSIMFYFWFNNRKKEARTSHV